MNFFLKRWLSDSTSAHVPTRSRKLSIEHLEDRTVPAITLPDVPNAQGMVQSSNPSSVPGGVAPELLQNPIRLSQALVVSSTGGGITFAVTNNLGQSWTQQASGITFEVDPLLRQAQASPNVFTVADAPSIAFDRSDTFYLAHIQRNADNTSGVLVADKFTINSAGAVTNLNQRRVLYRWVNQDPVFNPSVGVHSDIQESVDPDTGAVQQNPSTGRGVYIAWNTDATQRSIVGTVATAAVFLAVSDNGGLSYSDPVGVNGNAAGNGHDQARPGLDPATAVNPEIQFVSSTAGQTPGTGGSTPGGNLAVFYKTNRLNNDAQRTTAVVGGKVVADVSNPFDPLTGGQLPANPLTVQQTFTGQPGAITGAVTPSGGVLTAQTTDFTLDVDLTTLSGFDTLRDMSVNLGVYSQDMERLLIELVPPTASNLPTVTLLNSRQILQGDGSLIRRFDGNGGVYGSGVGSGTTPGMVGGNPSSIGLVRSGTNVLQTFGLEFDQQAARYVNDPANVAPFIIRVRPEDFFVDGNGRLGLSKYNGFDASRLSGQWTLRVTNYKANDTGGEPPSRVTQFEMKFISRVNAIGFDSSEGRVNPDVPDPEPTAPATAVTTPGRTGTATAALPLVTQGTQQVGGLQGWYSVAVDTTKGSFSPFQGRMYVAYTTGSSILVASSDDGGESWGFPVQVNDQGANDGISNGGRSRFQPTITVDQTTGTVVAMWYDMRWDASDARPVTFIATSVDGGNTWSPNAYLNETKSARDAVNRTLVNIEPVPNNLSTLGVFGGEQGLIAYDGTVVPVWVGNVNGTTGGLMTATTAIASGPRVLQGDMGPVSDGFETAGGVSYNDVFTLDGTRQLDAFHVRFDRRIDPTTFTVADVRLRYQDTTGAAAQDISAQVLSVEALDPDQFGATRFLIHLAPQARVGTYSYAVGPDISDRIRETVAANLAPLTNAPDVAVSGTSSTNGVTVTGLNPLQVTAVTANVQLSSSIPAQDLVLRLINNLGESILLTLGNGNSTVSAAFGNTTFSDAGAAMGPAGPYGTVRPAEQNAGAGPLASLLGLVNGNWQLQAINLRTGGTVTVNTWSLTFTENGTPRTFTAPVLLPPFSAPTSPLTTSSLFVNAFDPIANTADAVKVSVRFVDPGAADTLADDLVLRLTGPNGAQVYLTADLGAIGDTQDRYGNTTFVDSGVAPGAGQFGYIVPLESLQAAFAGGFTFGTWTLEVVNGTTGATSRTVTLEAWSLTLNNVTYHPDALYPVLIPGEGVFTDSVTGTPPPNLSAISVFVDFSDPVRDVPDVTDLLLELIGPNGQTVTLVNAAGTGTVGASFDGTRFQDGAPTIAGSTAPYTFVAPAIGSLLTAFGGLGGAFGQWQLRVTNLSSGATSKTIQLDRWQLSFQGGALGNRMDQDANGVEAEVTDAFSNPTPNGGVPFVFPYTVDSLPLIIPGPRLVSSTPVLTADGSISSIDLTFDKDMLASSFTPAQVLELRTTTGLTINGPFTVTANPSGTPPINANRVFRVTFPTQVLSGHYSLLLGAGIKSASGLEMDPNMNAGVELVTGRVADPTAASVLSSEYNTGAIGLTIPVAANGTTPSVTTHTLTVTDQFFLTQLLTSPIRMRLDITTVDARNLSARLIAPDGTAVQLFTNVGGFGINGFANFTNTQFSDFAAPNSLIQNAGAPFTGTFLPQQQLSVFDGLASAGEWKLEISNRSTTQGGTLNFWGLSLPEPILGSGLGEPVIDQTTVGFRVFTSSPSQTVSSTAWTPLGPTTASDALDGAEYNGVVTVTAVDPSDPSGNTVYAGGATGGLWKTTNFLTLDAVGPTWIPLLDAASAKAMRISSITIIPQNNNSSQDSIVLVGTGDADLRTGGVGFLRSNDGGRTFRLIDSTVNSFNTLPTPTASTDILPVEHPGRDHVFSNNLSYVYKVVVDPVRLGNGEFVIYAAVGGNAAAAGLWRSITSGRSWVRIQQGECNDFVLGPNRVDVLDANGNPVQTVGGTGTPTLRLADIGYAAFTGAASGVYFSQSISTTSNLTLLNGGQGKPLFSGAAVGNLGTNPNQNPDRILLAAVNATANNDPLAARVYQGWLYALVIHGGAPGLYMTKDFGANWTLVDLDASTNNETTAAFDYGTTTPLSIELPRYHALAADPTDPNVVYVGGASGVFRIDVSTLNDAHAQVGRDNSKGGVGPQTEGTSDGALTPQPTVPPVGAHGPARASDPYDGTGAHFTRIRDPLQPFVTSGTQTVGGGLFTNTGENAQMTRLNGVTGNNRIRNIETMFDPLTRKTRVLVSTELGVYTAADEADTTRNQGIYGVAGILDSIGSAVSVNGNRSSNLSMADVVQTGVQPSELSADLAGLYNRPANSSAGQWIYSVTEQAYINAPRGILRPGSATYGQEQWQAEVLTAPYLGLDFVQYAGYVQTDPQGSGVVYQYRPSVFTGTTGPNTGAPSTDIFSVSLPGQPSIGRTNGLFANGGGEWSGVDTAYFAVNPADPLGVVISAPNSGRVYLTTDQGVNWFEAGAPGLFGNSQGTALAFGGRDPSNPTGDRNGFFYNGTAQGRIWVTRDAGSNWTEISAGLPTGANAGPILQILANPRTGTYDAYAITATGVFYKADSRTAAAWVNVTGNLFSITKQVFGETVTAPILTAPDAVAGRVGLTALAVDWRFAVPGQQVVLYAAGDTGVFRSTDGGTTWALFPANQDTATLADDGGYLPNARITDLDLVYGDLNSTGVPNQFNGRNVLIASTYGRGLYAVRLDVSNVPVGLGSTGPFVSTAPLTPPNATTGVASITLNFGDANNPNRVSLDTLNAATMAIVGPGGVRPTFTVTDISPLSGGASLLNTFRIDFTPPTLGSYTLNMNVNVRDTSGRRLNQDRDGTNGENPQDFFSQTYAITVNRPPTVTAVPNQGLVVNTASSALAFTIGDPDVGDLATLTVTRATSNGAVLPLGNIALGGTGANRTVTVTPTGTGIATVTLRVTDTGGRFAETTFTVSSVAAAVIPFADPFTRPDAPNLGGNWVLRTGTAEVSFESTLTTSPLAVATINNVSQVNSVTQGSVGLSTGTGVSSAALVARYTGAAATATMYYAGVFLEGGVVTARIYRQVNGVATELLRSAAFVGPVAPQYDLRFDVVNDSLKLFVDGNLSLFTYDIAITATGQTGFRTTAANRLDTFSADDIVLTPPAALPPVGTNTATDTFTQATGTQLDRDWRDRVGNLSVTGNRAVGQAAGANLSTYNLVQPTANAGAQTTVAFTAANQSAGVVLRYSGTTAAADTNMYWGRLVFLGGNQQTASILRNVNGVWSTLVTSATLTGNGGILRFEANGSQLKLFVNNVRVATAYDAAPLAAGGVGLRTNQGAAADDFFAFALGTTASLPAADNFPASPPLNQLSSQWTERAGAISVATGAAVATGTSLATLNGVTGGDVVVTATVPPPAAAPVGLGLVARFQSNGNFYWGALNNYSPTQYMAVIWKYVNGTATPVNLNTAVVSAASAANGVLRFELLGSSLKLYLNDVLVSFGFDTTYTTGGVGLQLANGAILDTFAAAERLATPPTVPGFTDAFTAGLNPQNALSTDWQERSGAYSVATGQATGRSTSQPNLAVVNGNAALTDVTITADLFFTAAGQSAALVARYGGTNGIGDQNYYFADMVTQANGDALIRLRRDVNGTKTILATTTVVGYFPGGTYPPATAPVLRFSVIGNQLSVFLDTFVTPLLTATDSTFAAGSVGMRTTVNVAVDNFTTS